MLERSPMPLLVASVPPRCFGPIILQLGAYEPSLGHALPYGLALRIRARPCHLGAGCGVLSIFCIGVHGSSSAR